MTRDSNRMSEAVTKLAGVFGTNVPTIIVYSRGTYSVTIADATVTRTPFNVLDGDMMMGYESRDYIVPAAELILNGTVTLPQSGDSISDNGRTYEVAVPKPLNLFERIGANGSVLKIHTKAVA